MYPPPLDLTSFVSSVINVLQFVFKSQAIRLYRSFLRETKGSPPVTVESYLMVVLDPSTRKEVMKPIREEFERRKMERDFEKIKYNLSMGKREFHNLQTMIELTRGRPTTSYLI